MELLKPKEVAKILKISLPHVYKLADRGQLPCVRWECVGIGKIKKSILRFEVEAIRSFIESHRKGSEIPK